MPVYCVGFTEEYSDICYRAPSLSAVEAYCERMGFSIDAIRKATTEDRDWQKNYVGPISKLDRNGIPQLSESEIDEIYGDDDED